MLRTILPPSSSGHAATFRFRGLHSTVPSEPTFPPPFVPVNSRKLARQHVRGSSTSCPDLSTLQISHSHSQPTRGGVNNHPSYPYPFQVGTVTQVYSSSPSSDIGTRGGPRKLASTGKRVSKKARGVLGKVRTFHRIAAAKMAHPTIKIDTNVQATMRGFPEDNDHGLGGLDEEERDHSGLDTGDTEDVPPFLCQSDEGQF